MVEEFGYTPEIVAFLKENVGRLNVSSDRRRAGVMRELDTGGWFAQTVEDEAVYRNYLAPLAGSCGGAVRAGGVERRRGGRGGA